MLLVNWTSQDTSFVTVDVFVVVRVAGDAAPASVNVSAERSTVPEQVEPLIEREDERVPLNADPQVDVIVAESFGNQVCSDDADVVPAMVKHSLSAVPLWVSWPG